ncbi:hypothetical protein E2562_007115 [Oryza meyeriana var. granulata]|uniref:F-box domain-containing protein n=1 Tax=Oryza meyeriana var. granulata TaxID=110450 RepID=A0A6G1F4Y4_9ORYZ|nr:hypothetical protein E2562_007115 [Oryza meyeriana var. granulata]
MTDDGGDMAAIPNDLLISEVLSRLPVKSLLRFRSVCRSWHDAMADPTFVRRHLELSHAARTPSVLAVYTRTDVDPDNAAPPEDVISFHRVRLGQSSAAVVELMQEEGLECADAKLLTSHCDGLVAVLVKPGKIFVCNPATREFFALPPVLGNMRAEAAVLGFDPCNGRYVVARCFYWHYNCHTDEYTGEQFLEYHIVHEVFVLGASGSGDWETTVTPPCPIDTFMPPAYARGAFYWAANDQSDETERGLPNALLRFAIHDRKFAVVPLPPGVNFMDLDDRDTLTELDGELCYTHPATDTGFDFWILLDEDRWSLRWRVSFGHPIYAALPLSGQPHGTLTVYKFTPPGIIYRFDERNNALEEVMDVEEVYWNMVDQMGSADYDYSKQCGDDYYDCDKCGGGVDDCDQCGVGVDDDGDEVMETLGGSDDHDVEQGGDGSNYESDYDDAEELDENDDDADARAWVENGYLYHWEFRDGRWEEVQDGLALPVMKRLFTYVESLVKIN